jgi:ATP-dependent Clp protease ATP-binding subunit ClpC
LIKDINARLEEKGLNLSLTKKVKLFLVDKGYDAKLGARPLRRAIESYVEDPLSEEVLRGRFGYGSKVSLTVEKDKIIFKGNKGKKSTKTASAEKKSASAAVSG